MDDNKSAQLELLRLIEHKVDLMDGRIDKIDVILARQEILLAEHIKRSNMLEAKLEPVEVHVNVMNGILKGLGIFSLLTGIIIGIYKAL